MFSWLEEHGSPIIVGHRGDCRRAPENTMASFRSAVRAGVHAIELDVRLTSDGEVVVIHDASLQRTAGVKRRISAIPSAELRTIDVGSWFGSDFTGERVPFLRDVLHSIPGRVGINVEIKHLRGRSPGSEVVRRCMEVIREAGAAGRVLLSSFHLPYLRKAMREFPEIPRGLLYHTLLHSGRDPLRLMKQLEASYLILYHRTIRRSLVASAHDHGYSVAEYSIDTSAMFARAVRFGVDAIITNEPARILPLLVMK